MTRRLLPTALLALLAFPAIAAAQIPFIAIDTEQLGASGPGIDPEIAAREEPLGPPIARSPGTDNNLGLTWESSIAVNRANPLQVAVVQGNSIRMSLDGGNTFAAANNLAGSLPATHSPNGDGSLAFDGEGRLFMSFLGNPVGGGGWDVFVVQVDPLTGLAIGNAANVTDQIGFPGAMGSDKPWIAADATLGDLYAGQLYVVWAVTGGGISGDWEIWGARSSDQGATWVPSVRSGFGWGPLSPWDASEGRAWTPHVATGANGDVWVSYHAQGNFITVPNVTGGTPDGATGQVPILRSTDGGISFSPVTPAFGPGEADITWNAQHRPGRISDLGIWTIGSNHAWVLPDPFNVCKLYVVTADDPDNDPRIGDAADIVMATSVDCGVTWNTETVDGGPDSRWTWQLFPSAAIDPQSGFIAVSWYDNRNALDYPMGIRGNSQFDLMVRYRTNGGFWDPIARVNDAPIDADASNATIGNGTPPTYRFGEYNGVAYGECMAHMVWSGNPVLGGNADTYYDREPEAGGDVDPPSIVCPVDIDIACGDDLDPGFTGLPTVDDNCDLNPSISYFDVDLPVLLCKFTNVARKFDRNFYATDDAGNLDSCAQRIRVLGDCCK